ncbi:MAG: META domain-containing protein [Candidatus Kapaibacterium sp.]|jgi:heat shock protein HslJ|nr:META domain-containing protein [Candidatus Kapabacteria bacterium]
MIYSNELGVVPYSDYIKIFMVAVFLPLLISCSTANVGADESDKLNNQDLENTKWLLIELNGREFDLDSVEKAYLIIGKDKERVNGHSGCNSFSGKYNLLVDSKISISGIASTKKYCQEIDYEFEYFKSLSEVNEYSVSCDTLEFKDNSGNLILKFIAMLEK